ADADADRAALGELDRVADEVEEDLAQLQHVGDHEADLAGDAELDAVAPLAGEGLERGGDALDEGAGAELLGPHLHAAGLDLGEVEDAADQVEEVDAGDADPPQVGDGVLVAARLGVL